MGTILRLKGLNILAKYVIKQFMQLCLMGLVVNIAGSIKDIKNIEQNSKHWNHNQLARYVLLNSLQTARIADTVQTSVARKPIGYDLKSNRNRTAASRELATRPLTWSDDMETEKITREEYESQSGLEFLSEGIALVEGLGRSLAADMPLDTPQARHGLVIMMDHIAVVLAKAEQKLSE